MRLAAEYVLPLRWSDDRDLAELTDYLERLSHWIDVTVIDGSEAAVFARHARHWRGLVRHLAPTVEHGANGKVRGVLTGLEAARHERVVLADDDVRYDLAGLTAVVAELRNAELARPQNVLSPRPWHARWDTARTLINRAFGPDYPGTYALRRSALPAGYDADALFENLEMERTVRAVGGRVRACPDLFVVRRPPSVRHFAGQRVRQAYDSLAQPGRLAAELAIAPLVFALRRRRGILITFVMVTVVLAETGRRRSGGATVFPRSSSLWAPLWVAERALTSWIALGLRLRGGVRYAGTRIVRPATPARVLRRRHGAG